MMRRGWYSQRTPMRAQIWPLNELKWIETETKPNAFREK